MSRVGSTYGPVTFHVEQRSLQRRPIWFEAQPNQIEP
jgi:hypothetical protein